MPVPGESLELIIGPRRYIRCINNIHSHNYGAGVKLNSKKYPEICSGEPEGAMRCHAGKKKAIYELIKCSYFKQERLFIILLNSTAMESFRIEHIVAAAVASGTDLRKQRSQQLLLCLQLARNRETVAHFLFFFKRRFLKKKKRFFFSRKFLTTVWHNRP